jgi:hypothetical protein
LHDGVQFILKHSSQIGRVPIGNLFFADDLPRSHPWDGPDAALSVIGVERQEAGVIPHTVKHETLASRMP